MEDKMIMDFDEKLTRLLREKTNDADAEADALISELEQKEIYKSKKFLQLMLHHKATLAFHKKEYDNAYAYALKGLKLTKPHFEVDNDEVDIFTTVEIELMNTIASILFTKDSLKASKKLWLRLKDSIELHYATDMSKRTSYLQVLFNLSSNLAVLKEDEICLQICNKGIELSKEERNYHYLSMFTYNKGFCLLRLNNKNEGVVTISMAYALFYGVDNMERVQHIKNRTENIFKIPLSEIYDIIKYRNTPFSSTLPEKGV